MTSGKLAGVFRFVSGSMGLYAAVERDCPPGDPRRQGKPDGSWLVKAGAAYPGAQSFWTEQGLLKYRDSGLMAWHLSVVFEPVRVQVARPPERTLYSDEHQILCRAAEAKVVAELPVAYVLRGR